MKIDKEQKPMAFFLTLENLLSDSYKYFQFSSEKYFCIDDIVELEGYYSGGLQYSKNFLLKAACILCELGYLSTIDYQNESHAELFQQLPYSSKVFTVTQKCIADVENRKQGLEFFFLSQTDESSSYQFMIRLHKELGDSAPSRSFSYMEIERLIKKDKKNVNIDYVVPHFFDLISKNSNLQQTSLDKTLPNYKLKPKIISTCHMIESIFGIDFETLTDLLEKY